jgi:hypothetical protein
MIPSLYRALSANNRYGRSRVFEVCFVGEANTATAASAVVSLVI